MNYLVVIDTNVLISALLSKHNDAATVRVLNAVFDGKIIPVFNEEILSVFTKQFITGEILPDPKDLVFYEVVMAKRDENAYLVTGNGKHFPKKPFVVTPNELLSIIYQ